MRAPADVIGVGRFLAMSLPYHLTHFLHVALPDGLQGFPRPTLSSIKEGARRACATKWEDALAGWDGVDANTATDRLPGRCFDGALVTALLEGGDGEKSPEGGVGFGFSPNADEIEYVEDVNGNDVEWTMGAAMCLIHPARTGSMRCDAGGGGARNDGATKAVAVVVLLCAFAVFAAVKGRGLDLKIPMVVPKNGGFRKGGGMRDRSASFSV